jgi:ribosomal-protein-serine acetyltransferase
MPGVLTKSLFAGAELRLLEEFDADELHHLIDANRRYLSQWMPWAPTETRESTLEFIRGTRDQLAHNNGLQTAIVVDGNIAGVIGVHGISWPNRSTSIGYWLGEAFQGRGIMTAAVRTYTDHAFRTWNLQRVELQAAVDNQRSRAVAERLGFVCEGVRRQAEVVGARTHDVALYAVLAKDWK